MQKPLTIKHFVVFRGSYVFLKQVTNYHSHLFSQCLAFSCASLPWSCPIFYIALSNVCIVMHNVCCVMHFMLHEQNQHLRESHVLCVCPLARHWCACRVAGCLVASLVPLQQKKDCKQSYSAISVYLHLHFFVRVFFSLHWMCICSISLTSVIASRSSSANFLSSSPLGEQKLTSCFFSEVNGLSMVMPWA